VADLFVSYKAEDRRRVARLVQALEASGFSVWWDAHIGGGSEWREEIERNLDAARCVIVVWSKGSTGPHGDFVRDEASRAMRRKIYLPVRIDRVDAPLGFGEQQTIDLTGWRGNVRDPRFQGLLRVARQRLGMEGDLPVPPQSRHWPVDRRAALAGGGALVAAAAVGGWFALKPGAAKANSIAVMPFANLSGDPEQAYFSDGIAEELRSLLSRIPSLKVVARTSSEAVRDSDVKAAARKLGVKNILGGSVRRSGQTLRIAAQLVDGGDGTERWSQTYNGPTGDSLAIQSDIAQRVAAALRLALVGAPEDFRIMGETDNPEAQDLKLQADAAASQGDDEATTRRSIDLLDAALKLDPHYANAMASAAGRYMTLGGMYASDSTDSNRQFERSEALARKAVRIAPKSADGYGALGLVLMYRLKLHSAAEQFAKMRAAGTPQTRILTEFAWLLVGVGRGEEGLAIADQVISVDPLNANAYFSKGIILKFMRRYREAEPEVRRAMELAPDRTWPKIMLGVLKVLQNQRAEARAILESVPNDQFLAITYLAVLDAREGNRASALAGLEQLRVVGGDASLVQEASILAQLGDRERALETIENAWRVKDPGLSTMNVDELYDPIREDPRFQAIGRQMAQS
jgi:serine/threonine-protein kinase